MLRRAGRVGLELGVVRYDEGYGKLGLVTALFRCFGAAKQLGLSTMNGSYETEWESTWSDDEMVSIW